MNFCFQGNVTTENFEATRDIISTTGTTVVTASSQNKQPIVLRLKAKSSKMNAGDEDDVLMTESDGKCM